MIKTGRTTEKEKHMQPMLRLLHAKQATALRRTGETVQPPTLAADITA
jgi:hypothetical protein